jgi:hypothetical protein
MMGSDVLMAAGQDLVLIVKVYHLLVEAVEVMVPQMISLHQIPPSAAVVIAPVVAFPWEIDPFRMSELISHEIQVPIVAQTES